MYLTNTCDLRLGIKLRFINFHHGNLEKPTYEKHKVSPEATLSQQYVILNNVKTSNKQFHLVD